MLASIRSAELGGDKIDSTSSTDSEFQKREIYSRLRRAVWLNPLYFKSYELLVDVFIHSGKRVGPNTLEFLRQGRLIRPRNFDYAAKLALLEIRSKHPENVREALESFLDAKAGKSLREQAVVLLKFSGSEPSTSFEDITEEGIADAEANIGYLFRKGSVPSYDQAIEWFQKSADGDSLLGQTALGLSYLRGEGVPPDTVRALELLRSAAEQDYMPAQNALGQLYFSDKTVTRDYGEALSWMKKAADQEDANAQNSYAWALATCPAIAFRDGSVAVNYAKKAIAQDENPDYLDTLAAAYAESGKFRLAVKTQNTAIDRLPQGTPISDGFLERLKHYENGKPWRENPDDPAP